MIHQRLSNPLLIIAIAACWLPHTSALALDKATNSRNRPTKPVRTSDLDRTQPIAVDGRLVYPEGWPIGPGMTPIEETWSEQNLPFRAAGVGSPTGPVRCVAEYEPMDGILVAWEGSNSWKSILAEMAAHITTTGNAKIYVVVDSNSEGNSALVSILNEGADEDRVVIIQQTTNTIWIRDYGPRFITVGGCRAIVDHEYNRPRPADNALNGYLSSFWDVPYYEIPLIHGGGNFHLNAIGESFSTELIVNENPSLTEAEIINYWQEYQNLDTSITPAFPTSVDYTQHIDMWMQIADDNLIMISDWPNNSGSTQDDICDDATSELAGNGWTVLRPPARSIGGTHYTYTNVVICNDLVLIPSYDSLPSENAQALAVWQSAVPDKTVVQVDCDAIVTSAGVMHCIVMHIPAPQGGDQPTAYLRSPRGGEELDPGTSINIEWIADDDESVVIDLLLSTDAGATFDQPIASDLADTGSYTWNVPDVFTDQARVRVVARDEDGNVGFDQSDDDITINGQPTLVGDINLDGIVDIGDFAIFLVDFGTTCGPSEDCPSDLNGDGTVNTMDFSLFLQNYGLSL